MHFRKMHWRKLTKMKKHSRKYLLSKTFVYIYKFIRHERKYLLPKTFIYIYLLYLSNSLIMPDKLNVTTCDDYIGFNIFLVIFMAKE